MCLHLLRIVFNLLSVIVSMSETSSTVNETASVVVGASVEIICNISTQTDAMWYFKPFGTDTNFKLFYDGVDWDPTIF